MIERVLCSVSGGHHSSADFRNDYSDQLFSDVPNIQESATKTFTIPMSFFDGDLVLTLSIPVSAE